MVNILERFKASWNAFIGRDPTQSLFYESASYYRPDRMRFNRSVDKSIVSTIYNRIAVDCAQISIIHARINDEGRYQDTIKSGLNNVLTVSANTDQTGRSFVQDAIMSMFDEGVVALVPVVADYNDDFTQIYDIDELRTGKIVEWMPHYVRVRLYNEDIGEQQEIVINKSVVAIVENPFYSIMNEPNSISQRLIRTLGQLDRTNEQNSAGKLDLIVQLPYPIQNSGREIQAETRRKSIEAQLTGSQYGIAYVGATEKIIQLNRSIENNLWSQATDLTQQLYNQFGLSEEIFKGTADEQQQLSYYNRTIEPILSALTTEMERKFLTKTARTQKQAIKFYRDPFKLVPVDKIAEIADKFTRNEIMSSNEIRSVIGLKPSDDPRADELINANINQSKDDQRANINADVPEPNNNTGLETMSKYANLKV